MPPIVASQTLTAQGTVHQRPRASGFLSVARAIHASSVAMAPGNAPSPLGPLAPSKPAPLPLGPLAPASGTAPMLPSLPSVGGSGVLLPLPSGDSMTSYHFEKGRRYAAGVSAPGVPMIAVQNFNTIDMLPGFSGAQVYKPSEAPIPSNIAGYPDCDFVVVATRSGETGDVELPPEIVWITEVYPDMPTVSGTKPIPQPPGLPELPKLPGQTTTAPPAHDNKILGMEPTTALLVGASVLVGGYFLVKS